MVERHERRPNRKREQGLNVARKFLCLAAQGNIDLTCNYWEGTSDERGSGRMKQGGEDVESRRQPRSATVCNMNKTIQRLSASVTACNSRRHMNITALLSVSHVIKF